jgi:hypothetical protein
MEANLRKCLGLIRQSFKEKENILIQMHWAFFKHIES